MPFLYVVSVNVVLRPHALQQKLKSMRTPAHIRVPNPLLRKALTVPYTLYRGAPRPNLKLTQLSGHGSYRLQMLGPGLYLTPEFDFANTFGEFVYELDLDVPDEQILRLSLEDMSFDTYSGLFHVLEDDFPSDYAGVGVRGLEESCNAAPSIYYVSAPPFVCKVGGVTYVVASCELDRLIHDVRDDLVQAIYGVASFDQLRDCDEIEDVIVRMEPLTRLLSYVRVDTTDLARIAHTNGYKVLWVDNTILPHDEVLVLDDSLFGRGLTIKGFERADTQ